MQADKHTHVANMHRELEMLYTADRKHMHTMLQTYKCVQELATPKICLKLSYMSERHDVQIRATTQHQLDIPFRRLQVSKKAPTSGWLALWPDGPRDQPPSGIRQETNHPTMGSIA